MATLNGEVGRPRMAVDAILRILSETLPGVLLDLGLPTPKGYHRSGEEIPNLPALVVSSSVMADPHGGGYTDSISAQVSWEVPHPMSRADWQVAMDVATVVRGLLFMPQFRGDLRHGDAVIWDYLIPTGIEPMVSDADANWGGFAAQYTIVQHGRKAGANDLWDDETPWSPGDLVVEADPADVVTVLNSMCGRPRLAIDGVLDVLQDSLPQMLSALSLPEIKGYHWAGEGIPNLPAIVVACSTKPVDFGTLFADQTHLTVNVLTKSPVGRREQAQAQEIATVARAVLCTGHVQGPFQAAEGGPPLWHWLNPTGMSSIPVALDADYGGYTAHFEVLQNPPGADVVNLW